MFKNVEKRGCARGGVQTEIFGDEIHLVTCRTRRTPIRGNGIPEGRVSLGIGTCDRHKIGAKLILKSARIGRIKDSQSTPACRTVSI